MKKTLQMAAMLLGTLLASESSNGQVVTQTLSFTGSAQTFSAPSCLQATITCYGANGANGANAGSGAIGGTGGLGAMTQGVVSLTAGETLNVYVGGAATGSVGGFNGAGNGSNGNSGAGGGATDIRLNGTALMNRIIVAGGGGGGGTGGCSSATITGGNGGAGGGGNGTAGFNSQAGGGGQGANGANGGAAGTGCPLALGTVGVNGTSGLGGNGGASVLICGTIPSGGGGGGGYFGGGGGGGGSAGTFSCSFNDTGGGGGGAGGTNYFASSVTNTVSSNGINSGNGYVVISYSLISTPTISVNSGTVCSGQSYTINPSGASSFTIQGGSSVVSPTADATYTVIGATGGCLSNVITSSVTVNALPVITVNGGSICAGASFTMSPSGAITYTYSSGSAVVSPTSNASYSITGTSAQGCVSSNTAVSSVTVNACTPATALNFDGANDYISIPYAETTTDITHELWFKTTEPNQGLFSITDANPSPSGYDRDLYITGGDINAYVWQNTSSEVITTSGTNYADGNWHHIAHVVSSSVNGQKLYVDGVLKASGSASFSAFNWNTKVLLGYSGKSATNNYFNGSIDEVRIWNITRSQCEINEYKNCEIPANLSGLVANYHFNQGFDGASNSGVATLTDASGNLNVGTLTNFTLSGTTSNWVQPGGVVSGSITPASLNPIVGSTVTNSIICFGNPVTLNGTGADMYVWTGGVTNGVSFSPTTTVTYTVIGTNTVTGCFNTATNMVTVNNLPIISVNSGTICSGQSFTMVASGASTYTYSSGSAAVTPTALSSYSVSGTDANGCVSSVAAVSTITVNNLPVVVATTNNTLLCTGQTATLAASGASTYTWSTNETTNDIAVTPTVQTTYTVNGTDANGCLNTTTITQDVSVCTGITSTDNKSSINVYPNPNNGLFTIELTTTSWVYVTNALGQVVINTTFDIGKHNLDIQNQPTGIYVVKVVENNQQKTIKIIKQ